MTRFSNSIALVALCLVAGCATIQTSPLNPLNWFTPAPATTAAPDPQAQPAALPALTPSATAQTADLRRTIQQVISVALDRTPDSVIVTAAGATATPGHFNAALVPVGIENDYLVLDFRAEPPPTQTAGQPRLTVGHVIDNGLARQLRGVRVTTRQNTLTRTF